MRSVIAFLLQQPLSQLSCEPEVIAWQAMHGGEGLDSMERPGALQRGSLWRKIIDIIGNNNDKEGLTEECSSSPNVGNGQGVAGDGDPLLWYDQLSIDVKP